MKKVLAAILGAALFISTPVYAAPSPETPNQTVSGEERKPTTVDNTKVENTNYTVDTKEDGTATFTSVGETTEERVKIPNNVTVSGVEYLVTEIKAEAFANASEAEKVSIPGSIQAISKNAFSGAKKLKTIRFYGKKSIKVEKGAFKGLKTSKMTFKVSKKKMSKKQFKKFKKALEKAGFKGKIERV
ncbi:leucine-rich repeat protein [Butyrivibrio sp. LC3010]|uniref:leucine-rich repeat protein n=1 Tax=Butyrivibrio sp. LC3010 TaxID=1280680 RepID=UPI0018CAE3CA|nr:leucine-rich repeat protein [Butyrivibrio sp. LC3010]